MNTMFSISNDDLFIKPFFSIAGLATQLVFLVKSPDPSKNVGVLLDIGDGTCRDILEHKLDFSWFNTVIISHGHYDHMAGLYAFLGIKRMLGHTSTITVVFPEHCIEVESCIHAFEMNYPKSIPFTILRKTVSISSISSLNITDDILVTSFPVLHRGSTLSPGVLPLIPACGYQVSSLSKNVKIAFSGDTAPTDVLYDLFNSDVDYGFIENTHPDDSWVRDKINRFHLTTAEAREFSKNCKQVILIHGLPQYVLDRE